MKAIAIYNNKGGTAKSTSVINIAYILAVLQGKRVLVVDTDGQQNTARFFSQTPLPTYGLEETLLNAEYSPINALRKTRYENIDVLASSDRMNRCAEKFAQYSEEEQEQRVNRLLLFFENDYDYIFIDMPPTLSCVTENFLRASDGIAVPIELGTFAVQGVARVTDTINRVGGAFLGCFITKFDRENKSDEELMGLLNKSLGSKLFRSVIPYSKIIRNSLNYRQTAYEYMHWLPPVECYVSLTDEIIRKVG